MKSHRRLWEENQDVQRGMEMPDCKGAKELCTGGLPSVALAVGHVLLKQLGRSRYTTVIPLSPQVVDPTDRPLLLLHPFWLLPASQCCIRNLDGETCSESLCSRERWPFCLLVLPYFMWIVCHTNWECWKTFESDCYKNTLLGSLVALFHYLLGHLLGVCVHARVCAFLTWSHCASVSSFVRRGWHNLVTFSFKDYKTLIIVTGI